MKVLFLTIGDRSIASTRVRVYGYLPYLYKENIKAFILHYTPLWHCRKIVSLKRVDFFEKILSKIYSSFVLFFFLIMTPFFDVVFIQKVVLSNFTISILKALNKRIIFDFDDALFIHKDMVHILKNSRVVVVSNNNLKEFVLRYTNKILELPTPVNVDRENFQRNGKGVTLGWLGSPVTFKYLYAVMPVLESLKARFDNLSIEFMGADKNLKLKPLFEARVSEWSSEKEREWLSRIDIGIAPLGDDEESMGKSGYKIFQYMSMAIPYVASPVGINKDVTEDGINGFLAKTPREWLDKLSLLIRDASLRKNMGRSGMEKAKAMYSYEVTASALIRALKEVAAK